MFDFVDNPVSEQFQVEWTQWREAFMAEGSRDINGLLIAQFIREVAEYARFDNEDIDALIAAAAAIAGRPELHEFMAFCVYHLQHSPIQTPYCEWPELRGRLGDYSGCFYMLAALSLIPIIRRKYAASGIPEDIIRDTTRQFGGFCRNHRAGYGVAGIIKNQLYWLKYYREQRLYRLGRLEYMIRNPEHAGLVLRRRRDGMKVALAPNGARYDDAGLAVDNKADPAQVQFRTVTLEETDSVIRGTVFSPDGRALRTPREFSTGEWEIFMRCGDPIIDMHIPPGGGMSAEVCRDSLLQAAAFFPARMPELDLKAIYCCSWIFNTQLEEMLPESNLAKFMRQPYLLPAVGDRMSGLYFVFCRPALTMADLPSLPRETSLQRAMLEILESGRDLRIAGMLCFLEDMPYFGNEYYRKRFRELGWQD